MRAVVPAEGGWRLVQVDEDEDESVGLRFRCVPVVAWEVARGDARVDCNDESAHAFPVPAPVHGIPWDEDRVHAHRHADGLCNDEWSPVLVCGGRDATRGLVGRYLRETVGPGWSHRPGDLPAWAQGAGRP